LNLAPKMTGNPNTLMKTKVCIVGAGPAARGGPLDSCQAHPNNIIRCRPPVLHRTSPSFCLNKRGAAEKFFPQVGAELPVAVSAPPFYRTFYMGRHLEGGKHRKMLDLSGQIWFNNTIRIGGC
jgi:hypothetical protein